MLTKKHKN